LIAVTPHERGSVLPVRAQPGARRDAILGEREGALRVSVTAAPDKGKANEAIVALLASTLHCRRSQITLLTGPTSRIKSFLVEGFTPEALAKCLP
jgi:uncharacterized protein YggU (UPF0235/DUF167 family)